MTNEFPDPMQFASRFCEQNGFTVPPGNSGIERSSVYFATRAREEYKAGCKSSGGRNDPSGKTGSGKGSQAHLSLSEKYAIRLRNNRKSTQAGKVFEEVRKRVLSKAILDVELSAYRRAAKKFETERRETLKRLEKGITRLEAKLLSEVKQVEVAHVTRTEIDAMRHTMRSLLKGEEERVGE